MATYAAVAIQDPFERASTPRPSPSSFRFSTTWSSYQSSDSPVSISPVENLPFTPIETEWPSINVISPSTASHHSVYSDEDDVSLSPRFALITSVSNDGHEELGKVPSPSTPVSQSGDELLYDVTIDERLEGPYFHPDFQAVLAYTKQKVKDISLALEGCPASHELGHDLHPLKQWAQQLCDVESISTKIMAFVGHEQAGKSDMIGALLDHRHLARVCSQNGLSLPIITEYRSRPALHDEPFEIELIYMTNEEIRELLQDLLKDFHAFYAPGLRGLIGYQEECDVRLKSERAWYTLDSMFRNRSEFTINLLLQYPLTAAVSLIDLLQKWATDSLATRPGGGAQTWGATASGTDEWIDKLEAFVSDPVDGKTAALWPFMRMIRVYLSSSILEAGVIIADCPSPRELNYSCARAVEHYLRNCHQIFVMTTMEKAGSDQSISFIINNIGQLRPLSIICTKSTDFCSVDIGRKNADISLQVRAWRQQIEALRMQAKRSEAQRRHGLIGALEEEVRERDLYDELDFGLTKFLTERRNKQVATELIDTHARNLQLGALQIFCVSSRDYWEARYDERERAISRLQISGIVDLRRHCRSIMVDAQFETAVAFMEHDVPALLGSLYQWTVRGADGITIETAAEVRQVVKSLEDNVTSPFLTSLPIHAISMALNRDFVSTIVLPIRQYRSRWRDAALEINAEWMQWDTRDYISFCRHFGTHITDSTGQRNWNEELIAPMRLYLRDEWGVFHSTMEERANEVVDLVHQVLDHLSSSLSGHRSSAPLVLQAFLSTLHYREACITDLIDTCFADLHESTRELEIDALYGHSSSYISKLMAPAYHAASALCSSSFTPTLSKLPPTPPHSPSPALLDRECKDIVTAHIASYRIFPKIGDMIEKRYHAIVCEAFDKMIEGITREVDALVRDMHMLVGRDQELCEAERYKRFANGLRERVKGAEDVVREGGEVIEDVKSMYADAGGFEEVDAEWRCSS